MINTDTKNEWSDEWYTPSYIIEAARATLGTIELDPASNPIANEIVKAKRYYTKEDDSLTKIWHGKVWLNPPYEQKLLKAFAEKTIAALEDCCEVLFLMNATTETKVFQMLARECNAMCLTDHRIKFNDSQGNPSGSPRKGNVIFYFGAHSEVFYDQFRHLGIVLNNEN